jgi:hypothetical protein
MSPRATSWNFSTSSSKAMTWFTRKELRLRRCSMSVSRSRILLTIFVAMECRRGKKLPASRSFLFTAAASSCCPEPAAPSRLGLISAAALTSFGTGWRKALTASSEPGRKKRALIPWVSRAAFGRPFRFARRPDNKVNARARPRSGKARSRRGARAIDEGPTRPRSSGKARLARRAADCERRSWRRCK